MPNHPGHKYALDVKLIIVKQDFGDNWYTIERAEHSNTRWEENYRIYKDGRHQGWTTYHMYSGRLEPETCIEGRREEMLALAHAIKEKLYFI